MASNKLLRQGVVFARSTARQRLPAGFKPAVLPLNGERPSLMSIESKDSINSRFTHSTVSTIEQIMRSRNPNYDLDASASERQHSDPVKVVRKAALYGSLIALLICGFILAIASLVMPWSGLETPPRRVRREQREALEASKQSSSSD